MGNYKSMAKSLRKD